MQNKLKIAISGTGFIEWTGGTIFLKNHIEYLMKRDNELYLLLPSFSYSNYPKFFAKNFKSLLKMYNRLFSAKENPELKEIFKDFEGKVKIIYHNGNILKTINKIRPDIIYPTWDKLYNKCKIPQIAYLYDCQHKYYPDYFKEHSKKSRDKYFQTVVDNYPAIIVASNNAKNDLIKFYNANPEKIYIAHSHPIMNPKFLKDLDYDVLEKYNIPKEYVMVSSQFWKHKSHITVFEAIKILKEQGQNVCLVCTGKMEDYRFPEYIEELKTKIKEWNIQDSIRLLGMIDREDQVELIKKTKILIQPSLYEGGAGAGGAIEAAAFLKPILMSDIPINKEYSQFENVFFFKTQDSNNLAKKITELLNTEFKKYTDEELINISKQREDAEINAIYAPVYDILNKKN